MAHFSDGLNLVLEDLRQKLEDLHSNAQKQAFGAQAIQRMARPEPEWTSEGSSLQQPDMMNGTLARPAAPTLGSSRVFSDSSQSSDEGESDGSDRLEVVDMTSDFDSPKMMSKASVSVVDTSVGWTHRLKEISPPDPSEVRKPLETLQPFAPPGVLQSILPMPNTNATEEASSLPEGFSSNGGAASAESASASFVPGSKRVSFAYAFGNPDDYPSSPSSNSRRKSPIPPVDETISEEGFSVSVGRTQFNTNVNTVSERNSSSERNSGTAKLLHSKSKYRQKELEPLALWVEREIDLTNKADRKSVLGALALNCLEDWQQNDDELLEGSEAEEDVDIGRSWKSFFQQRILHPFSLKRMFWDVLSLCFISWDLVTIPMDVFDPPPSKVFDVMAWMTRIFWLVDLPINFITGCLMPDGKVEMRLGKIARQYLRGWMLPDAAIVTCDWCLAVVMTQQSVMSQQTRQSIRTFRLVRLLRLFRFIKLVKIPENLAASRIWSERISLVNNVVMIIGGILSVSHITACMWYGVALLDDTGENWVKKRGYDGEDWGSLYVRCFHWSIAQFVGELVILPENTSERIFVTFITLLTFVIAAAVVSAITSSLTRLQFIAGKRSTQLSDLRRYLVCHNISPKLMLRIQRNAEWAMLQKQRHTPEKEVELIWMITEPLRIELHFEEHFPSLCHHPLFHLYMEQNPAGMRQICHQAVSEKIYQPFDVVFSKGEIPSDPHMYFIKDGVLTYQQKRQKEIADSDTWAAEAVLWVHWAHRGLLRANTESTLLLVSAQSFQEITSRFENHYPSLYAVEFARQGNEKAHFTDLGNKDIANDVISAIMANLDTAAAMKGDNSRRQSTFSVSSNYSRGGTNNSLVSRPSRRESLWSVIESASSLLSSQRKLSLRHGSFAVKE